jgi:hypothetical protein
MGAPEVPIEVDPETGIWRTDGLPMIYLPRHFLVNNHKAVEEALGVDAYRAILLIATDKSAYDWCVAEALTHGLSPEQTFRHYFRRLSQRGWGQFSIEHLNIARREVAVRLDNSVFVLENQTPPNKMACYMFEGFVTGAMRYVSGVRGSVNVASCIETQCAADGAHEHCRFELERSKISLIPTALKTDTCPVSGSD